MNKNIVRAMGCCAVAILALPAECLALTSTEGSQPHAGNQIAHRWQRQSPETTSARPAFQNQQRILNGDRHQQVERRVEGYGRRWRRNSYRFHRRGHDHQRYWGDYGTGRFQHR